MIRSSFLAASALCLCSFATTAAELLIADVTLISPQHERALPQHHVLIRDDRIITVSSKPITARGATRIDGRGKFLAPGIMDSHVHVSDPAGLPWTSDDPQIVTLREAYMRQQPRSYLYFGVTQVLDMNGIPAGIAAFEAQPQRPDLFRCGGAVTLDGYPALFVEPPLRYQLLPDYVYEPANAAQHPLPKGADPAKHTPEAVVERIASSGARCVKIFIEDGFGTQSDWPIMSRETLQRMRAATRKHGMLLVAHANAIDMQRIAMDAGVDVITHGLWNWNEHADNKPIDAPVPEPIASHLRNVHAKRIGLQPTLRVVPGTGDLFRADTLKDPMYAKVVPPAVLAWYATEPGQWFKREVQRGYGKASDMEVMHSQLLVGSRGMRAVRYLHELGHPLLVASDTPSAPTYGNQPGYDTYREMRMMAQSGLPLPAILRAATVNNARQFGLDEEYGTIEPGKIANLLLLRASPLQTVRAWADIDKVILRGTVIERSSLAADKVAGN